MMNKYKLFLKDDCSGRLGKGGEYTYEDGVLEINWYGEKSWHPVRPESALLVTLDDGETEIRRLDAPKTYPAKLLWLCGVPRVARCKSLAEYDTMVEGHKDSPVQHLGGEGWQIAKGLGPEGRDYIVAGWVDPKISNKQRRKMLEHCGTFAPDWYVDKLLRRKWE